jgi:hypothetical protein
MRENRGMTERPIVIARLDVRLQPLDRGSLYEVHSTPP